MPGHYNQKKIEGGGKGGTSLVWTEGKNADWQKVASPVVAGNTALKNTNTNIFMTPPGNTDSAKLDKGKYFEKDYNRIMKDVAQTVMNVALKTWNDRNTNNAGTKLSKEKPLGRVSLPKNFLSSIDKRGKGK